MKVKEESGKAGLKLDIQKTKIPASGPINSWQTDAETITADCDCSHEIKRHLLLGRKAMTKLDSELKMQRHHFANKGPHSQNYSFSGSHVQM